MTNVIIWDTEVNQRPLTHGADAADGDQQQSHSQADRLHNSADTNDDDDDDDDDDLLSLFQLNHQRPYKQSQCGYESFVIRFSQAKLQWCDQITEFPLDARQTSEIYVDVVRGARCHRKNKVLSTDLIYMQMWWIVLPATMSRIRENNTNVGVLIYSLCYIFYEHKRYWTNIQRAYLCLLLLIHKHVQKSKEEKSPKG